jgi:hypothetical protein
LGDRRRRRRLLSLRLQTLYPFPQLPDLLLQRLNQLPVRRRLGGLAMQRSAQQGQQDQQARGKAGWRLSIWHGSRLYTRVSIAPEYYSADVGKT